MQIGRQTFLLQPSFVCRENINFLSCLLKLFIVLFSVCCQDNLYHVIYQFSPRIERS